MRVGESRCRQVQVRESSEGAAGQDKGHSSLGRKGRYNDNYRYRIV
jgi:hypothetical protein